MPNTRNVRGTVMPKRITKKEMSDKIIEEHGKIILGKAQQVADKIIKDAGAKILDRANQAREDKFGTPTWLDAPQNIVVPPPVPAQVHTLIKDGVGQYDFHPQPTLKVVGVVYTNRRGCDRQELDTEEARQLWRRLIGQGFERF